MISTITAANTVEVIPDRRRRKASGDRWLSLAAAPTFTIMALLTAVYGDGMPDMLCSAAHHASPLGGMVPMYLLMAAFHARPWLKLISSQAALTRSRRHR
jgi:hypothetical protein